MSSAFALFDMRKVGLSFASAALAGLSEGNTLSVTAITGPAIAHSKLHEKRAREPTIAGFDRLPAVLSEPSLAECFQIMVAFRLVPDRHIDGDPGARNVGLRALEFG